MIRLGTIGTSWITAQFIEAAQQSGLYQVRATYSRSVNSARELAQRYQIEYYTDELNTMLFDPDIDAIYVASPNAIHFEQTMRAIRAGKHVIVEKPMFATVEQWRTAHALATEMNVLIFEGVVHVHNQNFRKLKHLLQMKMKDIKQPFMGANLNIGQYSSKYPAYNEAVKTQTNIPNVFNLEFAGGTLMDIGVYPIYVAIDLFGTPRSVRYHAVTGVNKVDLFGHIILSYASYQVSIFVSKAVHSCIPSEIYLDNETLVIEGITRIDKVHLINSAGQSATVIEYRPDNPMSDEVVHFAEMIQNRYDKEQRQAYEKWTQLSLQVAQVMEDLRHSANITFE